MEYTTIISSSDWWDLFSITGKLNVEEDHGECDKAWWCLTTNGKFIVAIAKKLMKNKREAGLFP